MSEEKLANLPRSDDAFWKHAEIETIQLVKHVDCKHDFIHKTAIEVECSKCNIGFMLDIGWHVKNGKIYTPEGNII